MNALLASALSLAASALSASEMSFRLSFASIGDGGCDVAGVDGGEETSLELDMIGSPFVGYCRRRRSRVCMCMWVADYGGFPRNLPVDEAAKRWARTSSIWGCVKAGIGQSDAGCARMRGWSCSGM